MLVSNINRVNKEAYSLLRDVSSRKREGEWKGGKKSNQIQPQLAHKESAFWSSTLKEGLNYEQINSA